jgi:lysyl-tRNA synthetase class 2
MHQRESYPNSFARIHLAAQLLRQHGATAADELERSATPVAIAGRLMEKRSAAGSSSGVLQDHSGRIEVLVSDEASGRSDHAAFAGWEVGDIIGVRGIICRGVQGELAVRAHEMQRLVKSLHPLSQAPQGSQYVELIVDRRRRSVFDVRARLIEGIRAFLSGTTYLEVETPILQPAREMGAVQFATHHNALDRDLYLRASAELYLKRLLVGGVEKIYEINRNFADRRPDAGHVREGTHLEIYCAYSNYLYMVALLELLLARTAAHALGTTVFSWRGRELDLSKTFARTTAAEGECASLEPTFVLDFPAATSDRARRKDGAPDLAERFELYIGGHKIADGCSVLNDPDEQAARLREAEKYDSDFVRALEYGMPPASGMSVSIDRLVMVLTDSASLGEVILFAPASPAEC